MKRDNQKLEKNFISVVVYIRNHEEYIPFFIETIGNVLVNNFEKSEIIFVNDLSNDNSYSVIKDSIKKHAGISATMINLSYYHGLERAMIAGQDMAIGDFVFEFDTPIVDYKSDEIMSVYNKCLKGFDIVGMSPDTKKSGSSLFYKLFQLYSKNSVVLSTQRFRITSRRSINRIKSISKTIPYRKAVYFNCGLKGEILKYSPINNLVEQCKENYEERFELAIDSLLFFTNIGWKIARNMSITMVILSVFALFYTVFNWVLNPNVVTGWTTTMLFLSGAFAGLFVLVTIAIKYLTLILFTKITKQDYVFESIEKIK